MSIAASSGEWLASPCERSGLKRSFPDLVVAGFPRGAVFTFQRGERRDDLLRLVPERDVASDQVRVDVRQPGAPTTESSPVEQVEEDRSAAEEGLDVAIEPGRVVATELREKLPLASCPLQEGADPGLGRRTLHAPVIGVPPPVTRVGVNGLSAGRDARPFHTWCYGSAMFLASLGHTVLILVFPIRQTF